MMAPRLLNMLRIYLAHTGKDIPGNQAIASTLHMPNMDTGAHGRKTIKESNSL